MDWWNWTSVQGVLSVPRLECGGSVLVQSLVTVNEGQGQVGTVMDDA